MIRAAIIAFVATLPLTSAHGFMSRPKSRNLLAREQNRHWCPHCLNGGGVGEVEANSIGGQWAYPEQFHTAIRHGLCGDPSTASAAGANQDFMSDGQFATGVSQATWQAGSVVDVEMVISTHHRGHAEFFLCNLDETDGGDITQSCLNNGRLTVVDDPTDPSFVDAAYPGRYYLPPKCSGDSAGTSPSPYFPDAYVYRARVQLPADVTCDNCVLQWYYVTANSCNPPGYRTAPWPGTFATCEGDGPGQGWWGPTLGDCLDGRYPEEFWNCADVTIVSDGVAPPQPQPTPDEPSPEEPEQTPTRKPTRQPTRHPTMVTIGNDNGDMNGECEGEWQQCAGSGISGQACCQTGLTCFREHQWYSQCRRTCPSNWECANGTPNTLEPTEMVNDTPEPTTQQPTPEPTVTVIDDFPTDEPTPEPTAADPTSGDDDTTCSGPPVGQWGTCAGSGITGTRCCEVGLTCFREHQWYSQCRRTCPSNWECANGVLNTPEPTTAVDPTLQPTKGPTNDPTPASPTVSPAPTVAGSNPWDLSTNSIMYNGQRVQLQGVAVTCLEYLLRGIGGECMADYNWSDLSNLITTPNQDQVNGLMDLLANPGPNVLSTVRFSLNAAYYLDVETEAWAANRASYPNLSEQYRTLLDNLVQVFTDAGLVVILDLHWNDDVTEQQAMALRDTDGTTGDSIQFWEALAQRYGDNQLVWYELYNEPFASNYQDWKVGGNGYEGMQPMYEAIRRFTPYPIVIAGQRNYAYDADSLVSFVDEVQPQGVVMNLHPYMGPYQAGDPSKNIDGYEQRVQQVLDQTGLPLIITEFGQYCCPADSACYLYSGQYDGDNMGYVEAVLTVNLKYDVSWTAWAWRPNIAGNGDCNQPDANDGNQLYNSDNYNGNGANWSRLFPDFFGVVTSQ